MRSITKTVEDLIEQQPFVQEALARQIINVAALAEQLRPKIEKELGQKIKFSAVNMAVRRIGEKLDKVFITQARFDETTSLTVQSDLTEIVLYKSENIQSQLTKLYNIVNLKKGDFITITQGLHEVMIITNAKHGKEIKSLFQGTHKKTIHNLSSITINIDEQAIHTIGLFYLVTRALNWNNINIVDIVSTYTEMTYILTDSDIARAYNVLKQMLNNSK